MNLEQLRAVIFDMDGLMLDTERIAWEIFVEACGVYNFQPGQAVFLKTIGTDWQRTREIMQEGYGPFFPMEPVTRLWMEKYRHRITHGKIPVKKGLPDLLKILTKMNLGLAVGTSTPREIASKQLQNACLLDYFSVIVCGNEVARAKPAPDIYLKACELLDLPPADCLVLEDSDNGVRAAYTAGAPVIQVPDLKMPAEEIKEFGHPVMAALTDVAEFFIQSTGQPGG